MSIDSIELSTTDGRSTLRLERGYAHPVERVWRAITDPHELSHWFPQSEPLRVTEAREPHLLAGTWHGDELRFELREQGEGCVLVFTHAFAEREKAARDAAGWDSCFARFDALLADEPIGERESLESWPAAHERYAKRFEVDPLLGREAFAAHTSQS